MSFKVAVSLATTTLLFFPLTLRVTCWDLFNDLRSSFLAAATRSAKKHNEARESPTAANEKVVS